MTISPDMKRLLAAFKWEDLKPEQKLACLKAIAEPNDSAKFIAHRAFVEYGFEITRNTVIGVANRAGLTMPGLQPPTAPERKSVSPASEELADHLKYEPKSKSTHKMKPIPKKVEKPKSKGVSFLELTNLTCRWPISGKPGPEMMCCGAPTMVVGEKGKRHSYCAYHRKMGTGQGTPSERRAVRRYQSKHSVSRAGVMDL